MQTLPKSSFQFVRHNSFAGHFASESASDLFLPLIENVHIGYLNYARNLIYKAFSSTATVRAHYNIWINWIVGGFSAVIPLTKSGTTVVNSPQMEELVCSFNVSARLN